MQTVKGRHAEYELKSGVPFALGRTSVLFDGTGVGGVSVAIKVFRSAPERGEGKDSTADFIREVTAQTRLDHGHILPVLDFGEDSWGSYGPFLVLPKCEGGNLRGVITGRDFVPLSQAVAILTPVASALDYAHQNGVIHGDIKPENILFGGDDKQHIYVADFGAAKFFPVQERITSRISVAGTGTASSCAYMSPEQIKFGTHSPRSDIYSLAIVAFELLTGGLPFDVSVTPYMQMTNKILGKLLDAREVNPLVSEVASNALKWGLSLEGGERPSAALDFVQSLQSGVREDKILSAFSEAIRDYEKRRPAPQNAAPDVMTATAKNDDSSARQILVSYSHKDQRWLERLEIALKPLIQNGAIDLWSDRRISPGKEWRLEIEEALCSTRVALLLVSQSFLASDFITKYELPRLLEFAKTKGVKILWIAASACLYENSGVANYQALNDPDRPLDSLRSSTLSRELVRIAEKIKTAMKNQQ